ncbi:hypothetical protein C8Q77DRAFT_305360 [Trametes polyzona]|nr:hypothetical protein C8Q77DRAFT_305360 [Trametes polyzona]
MRWSNSAFSIAVFGLMTNVLSSPAPLVPITIDASLPVSALSPARFPQTGVSLVNGALHSSKASPLPEVIDNILLLCAQLGCLSCTVVPLSGLNANTCFTLGSPFVSAAFVQPNNAPLPFNTSVGPSQCSTLLQLPTPNTCFNVNGPTQFNSFALIPA